LKGESFESGGLSSAVFLVLSGNAFEYVPPPASPADPPEPASAESSSTSFERELAESVFGFVDAFAVEAVFETCPLEGEWGIDRWASDDLPELVPPVRLALTLLSREPEGSLDPLAFPFAPLVAICEAPEETPNMEPPAVIDAVLNASEAPNKERPAAWAFEPLVEEFKDWFPSALIWLVTEDRSLASARPLTEEPL
jgi:hypothetical protein